MLGGWRRGKCQAQRTKGWDLVQGGGGFRRSKGFVSLLQRDDGSFTVEKVTLAFQDLGHLLDPGLTDCRV